MQQEVPNQSKDGKNALRRSICSIYKLESESMLNQSCSLKETLIRDAVKCDRLKFGRPKQVPIACLLQHTFYTR
jgi:hypothetical protein